jgi:hypothetical protein
MAAGFADTARDGLRNAVELYHEHYRHDPEPAGWLNRQLERFDDPLRIAVAGPPGSGKSTLINALVGDEVAPIELGGLGQPFTWYQDGPAPRATLYQADLPGRELPARRVEGSLRVEVPRCLSTGGDLPELVVDWPARALRRVTLIDTPATGPGGVPLEDIRAEADAVVYTTPSLADPDLRALRPSPVDPATELPPVDLLVVLSRADQTGGGRIDALTSAGLIARRRDRDPRVRGLCQGVIAVSGLLGFAARTLREEEYDALVTLARAQPVELGSHLVSVDRFTGPGFPLALPASARARLLARFGLSGIRLATSLLRTGVGSRAELADALLRRSGLAELRTAVADLFVAWRDVLKARAALAAVRTAVRSWPHPDGERLSFELERAVASGHELVELRLLAALRTGRTGLPADLAEQARRLVGGYGSDPRTRFDLAEDADDEHAWAVAEDTLARWQDAATDPSLGQDQRRAALVVVRTCEGLLTRLARADRDPLLERLAS